MPWGGDLTGLVGSVPLSRTYSFPRASVLNWDRKSCTSPWSLVATRLALKSLVRSIFLLSPSSGGIVSSFFDEGEVEMEVLVLLP